MRAITVKKPGLSRDVHICCISHKTIIRTVVNQVRIVVSDPYSADPE